MQFPARDKSWPLTTITARQALIETMSNKAEDAMRSAAQTALDTSLEDVNCEGFESSKVRRAVLTKT
jgi:hypothetical protein